MKAHSTIAQLHLNLTNYICNNPISKKVTSEVLGIRTSTYEFLKGYNSTHNTQEPFGTEYVAELVC